MTGRCSVQTPIEDTFTKYLTDRGKGDAGAGSHEFACGVSNALVDDGEAIIITDVAYVLETVHDLS